MPLIDSMALPGTDGWQSQPLLILDSLAAAQRQSSARGTFVLFPSPAQ